MKIGVWGHPCDEFPEGHDSVDEMARRLETLREGGVSQYFACVAIAGRHYFASEVLGEPERDLLAPLIEAGRRCGVEIRPVLGLGGRLGVGRGLYQPPLDHSDAPEWALDWPCAAWGENHERSVLVADELLGHAPGGLHIDYARFPNAEVLRENPCACARCQRARLRWLGKPYPEPHDMRKPGVVYKEMQMRMEFVRAFVEAMRGITDHHDADLSAAVRGHYYEDALEEGQDWADWCADGLLDMVCPLSFTLSFGAFARLVAQHRRLVVDSPVEWMEGIGLRTSSGRLDFDAFERQVVFSDRAGSAGVCIADAAALGEDELRLLGELAAG
ncbi:MAG: hypothetical protein ACQER1_09000 [Armatimonadota bacterium]